MTLTQPVRGGDQASLFTRLWVMRILLVCGHARGSPELRELGHHGSQTLLWGGDSLGLRCGLEACL